jgi:hypothetical protein
MRRALLTVLVLAFTLGPAEARHAHWGFFGFAFRPHAYHRNAHHHRYAGGGHNRAVMSASAEPQSGPEARTYSKADLVPQNWQQQQTDSTFKGQRFVSPDGAAWLEIYTSPADQEPIEDHMKAVAFGEGEQITSLRGEGNWVEVSGFKANRMFYRKIVLACAGKSWHEIAFEFPQEIKNSMGEFVSRTADAVQNSENQGCEATARDDQTPSGTAEPSER